MPWFEIIISFVIFQKIFGQDQVVFLDTDTQSVPVRNPSPAVCTPAPFPTAYPSSGLAVNAYERTGTGLTTCGCIPAIYCQSGQPITNGAGNIDIRIVTSPPQGVVCLNNFVYCCITTTAVPVPTAVPGKQCGTRQQITVPGTTIQPGQSYYAKYPWEGIILCPGNVYAGTGALLDTRRFLTVAHKVSPYVSQLQNMRIRIGDWDIQSNVEPYPFMDFSVTRIVVHPQFNPSTLANDVAIIILSQNVPVNNYPNMNTVCLPARTVNFTGQRCWISGWGKDTFGTQGKYQRHQKEVDVPILSQADCETRLRATRLGQYFQLNQASFICAGGEEGKDACTGDGGSPLVCELNGQNYVVGLTAWGIGCASRNVPGVYVNVINFLDWIQQQIA